MRSYLFEVGLHDQAEFAKSLGFSGKSAIHPRQLPVLHRAQRVLDVAASMADTARA